MRTGDEGRLTLNDDVLADLIASFYGAAAGAVAWTFVGRQLAAAVNAPIARLFVGTPNTSGRGVNLFEDGSQPVPPWYLRNPYLEPARRVWAGVQESRPVVAIGPEVVADATYLRSAFYADHGRRLGMRFEIGTTLLKSPSQIAPLGLYRPESAGCFGEAERAVLLAVRPHLSRALQLWKALAPAMTMALAGVAVIEGMSQPALVVDPDLRVVYANRAAEQVAARPGGVRLARRAADDGVGGATFLRLPERRAAAELEGLVRAVALRREPGGTVLAGMGLARQLAISVCPLPGCLISDGPPAGAKAGLALILMRVPGSAQQPSVAMLAAMFGLSRSEAAIAAALAGGRTAAEVAAARRVSLETVRSQIRAVLRKTGAANLRALEAVLATVPAG